MKKYKEFEPFTKYIVAVCVTNEINHFPFEDYDDAKEFADKQIKLSYVTDVCLYEHKSL